MDTEERQNLGGKLGEGRDPKTGRFLPGHHYSDGNKGSTGRPRDEFRRRMRDRSLDAEQVLVEALEAADEEGNPLWRPRIAASNAILDRAWGKPEQKVELTGEDDEPDAIELTGNDDLPDIDESILDEPATT